MSLDWVAKRLGAGTRGHLAHLLYLHGKKTNSTNQQDKIDALRIRAWQKRLDVLVPARRTSPSSLWNWLLLWEWIVACNENHCAWRKNLSCN
jgi:hypothetical protein